MHEQIIITENNDIIRKASQSLETLRIFEF